MCKFIRFTLASIIGLALSACSFPFNPVVPDASVLRLTVQAQNATGPFNTVGQVINYNYVVTNTGNSRLAGPVIITDAQRQITCPEVNTVGNLDAYLDLNESITCTGTYSITQTDLTTGSVTNVATANVGGVNSNPSGVTVPMNATSSVLKLTKTANPTSYNQIGQTITYTYVITNTGAATLGPSQFTISDNRLGAPFNCGAAATSLATNQTVTCTAPYVITQADMSAASLTNSATASGGGAEASQAASATVTNLTITPATPATPSTPSTPSAPSNLPAGATIQHQVIKGEWLIQIARCYGANFEEVRNANRQITDPHLILPEMIVTVPRIGSVGRIYGPPCIERHIVQSGDTWASIAQKYNADVEVLQTRNGGTLSVGRELIVPKNSAGGTSAPLPPPPSQPIRLTIPPGSTSVTQPGSLPPLSIARYVLNAGQGQVMSVTVTAPANSIAVAVYDPAGAVIKPGDANVTWSGTLQQTGDYRIDIASASSTSNVTYTLQVSLTAATVTLTPTPTATATSTTPVSTSTLQQAADINSGPGQSRPAFLAEYNGVLYFQADGGDGAGNELWKYDGATASRVADINNGANGSNPAYLTVYNGALYFGALSSDGTGNELWKYDGTNATRVADIWNGAESSTPSSLIVLNNTLYFSANGNDGTGQELWKFDGTNATRAADILAGAGSSAPAYPALFNGALYFQADGGDGVGHELWRYDGTTASRAADIWNGAGNSNPSHLAVFNNALYFSANGNDSAGSELWKFDGTNATRVTDIWSGTGDSNPAYLSIYNGALYFGANDGGGIRLWRYDGTNAARVPETNGISVSNPAFLTAHKNAIYFQADGNNGAGQELWRYNNTTG
jgi:uncharacterized repeat protein (TIGR01451 family)